MINRASVASDYLALVNFKLNGIQSSEIWFILHEKGCQTQYMLATAHGKTFSHLSHSLCDPCIYFSPNRPSRLQDRRFSAFFYPPTRCDYGTFFKVILWPHFWWLYLHKSLFFLRDYFSVVKRSFVDNTWPWSSITWRRCGLTFSHTTAEPTLPASNHPQYLSRLLQRPFF